MKNHPDAAILLMSLVAVLSGIASNIAASQYLLPLDLCLFWANFAYIFACYMTSFFFFGVASVDQLDGKLARAAEVRVDITQLFVDAKPAAEVPAERVWEHKKISNWVLIKTYATDSRTMIENLRSALFVVLLAVSLGGGAAMVWLQHVPLGTSSSVSTGPVISAGFALSPTLAFGTLVFTTVRIYWPILETARRNLKVLREI